MRRELNAEMQTFARQKREQCQMKKLMEDLLFMRTARQFTKCNDKKR